MRLHRIDVIHWTYRLVITHEHTWDCKVSYFTHIQTHTSVQNWVSSSNTYVQLLIPTADLTADCRGLRTWIVHHVGWQGSASLLCPILSSDKMTQLMVAEKCMPLSVKSDVEDHIQYILFPSWRHTKCRDWRFFFCETTAAASSFLLCLPALSNDPHAGQGWTEEQWCLLACQRNVTASHMQGRSRTM